jgi:hypothetical protein
MKDERRNEEIRKQRNIQRENVIKKEKYKEETKMKQEKEGKETEKKIDTKEDWKCALLCNREMPLNFCFFVVVLRSHYTILTCTSVFCEPV